MRQRIMSDPSLEAAEQRKLNRETTVVSAAPVAEVKKEEIEKPVSTIKKILNVGGKRRNK